MSMQLEDTPYPNVKATLGRDVVVEPITDTDPTQEALAFCAAYGGPTDFVSTLSPKIIDRVRLVKITKEAA